MIVIGDIEKIEGNKAFVKIVEHDTTYECYMMQTLTGKVKIDIPYSIGDQVVVNLQDGRNIVLGAIYNEIDQRDSEAEFEKVLVKSKKFRVKATEEIEESASTIKINSNNVLFNSGVNDGMLMINPTVARFNAIETQINTLKSLLNSWIPVPMDGAAALKSIITTWSSNQMSTTQKSQLENQKVKH